MQSFIYPYMATHTRTHIIVNVASLAVVFVARWHFAYTCVLEETVRRRRKMWSWEVIKAHRRLCAEYRDLYKSKLMTNKPSSQLIADLEV